MIGVLACLPGPALAEKTEIAIAKQFSIAFLPLIVMERDRLIEKHAREAAFRRSRSIGSPSAGRTR
ncbi:hypothetical protein ACU4GR_12580 [Methylobacterium oryzae CBMB20]